MERFEYAIVPTRVPVERLAQDLAELGRDGWEAVGTITVQANTSGIVHNDERLLMKRPR